MARPPPDDSPVRKELRDSYFFTWGQGYLPEAASLCPGDSGGPVYLADRTQRYVVGVNAHASRYGDVPALNWHTRLDDDTSPNTAAWLESLGINTTRRTDPTRLPVVIVSSQYHGEPTGEVTADQIHLRAYGVDPTNMRICVARNPEAQSCSNPDGFSPAQGWTDDRVLEVMRLSGTASDIGVSVGAPWLVAIMNSDTGRIAKTIFSVGPDSCSRCDDNNPCTDDVCVMGRCTQRPSDPVACDDNNPLTTDDTCSDGVCRGTLLDHAKFLDQTGIVSRVVAGTSFEVMIRFANTGGSDWTDGTGYALGSQAPQDNTVWGTNRIPLTQTIRPGEDVAFIAWLTAPTTPGTYTLRWRLVREGVQWFGESSAPVDVVVVAPSADAASPPPDATVTDGDDSGQRHAADSGRVAADGGPPGDTDTVSTDTVPRFETGLSGEAAVAPDRADSTETDRRPDAGPGNGCSAGRSAQSVPSTALLWLLFFLRSRRQQWHRWRVRSAADPTSE